MSRVPGVVWAGSFDEDLQKVITIFASLERPPIMMGVLGTAMRRLSLKNDTVENLCKAVINASDAVRCIESGSTDTSRNFTFAPTSILTETEKEQIFSTAHSPFFGALVSIVNIVKEYSKQPDIDRDTYIVRPLKQYWSRMIRHLWDVPARSLGAHHNFEVERYIVPVLFDAMVQVERSFASVIEDDLDLTISLVSRNWVHATGTKEMGYFFKFFLMLIPRIGVARPSHQNPLFFVTEGMSDPYLPILRRILQDNEFISKFIKATAGHLRRFSDFEAETTAVIIDKIWSWAVAHKQDPLCSQFVRKLRTSAPFWRSLFQASLKSLGQGVPEPFATTLHYHMSVLAVALIHSCNTASDAEAVTKLLVSTCILDALEASLEEVIRNGTEDDQVGLCRKLVDIYTGLSYGIDTDPLASSLMRRQLPRPRATRQLWDISLKVSGGGPKKAAPSHAARTTLYALEHIFLLPTACKRRGCDKILNARCARCGLEYCGLDCQKRDWKDHKMICGIAMEMSLAEKDESFLLVAGAERLALVKAEMGRD